MWASDVVEDISANVEWRRHDVRSGAGPMVSHINLKRLRVMELWRIHIIRSVVPACVAGSVGGPLHHHQRAAATHHIRSGVVGQAMGGQNLPVSV